MIKLIKFDINSRENNQNIETIYDKRYETTVLKNSATNEIYKAYFKIMPSGKQFDSLKYRLFINDVEMELLIK